MPAAAVDGCFCCSLARVIAVYITGMPGFDVCFFKKKTEKALV